MATTNDTPDLAAADAAFSARLKEMAALLVNGRDRGLLHPDLFALLNGAINRAFAAGGEFMLAHARQTVQAEAEEAAEAWRRRVNDANEN
jgi:hypothetical protein